MNAEVNKRARAPRTARARMPCRGSMGYTRLHRVCPALVWTHKAFHVTRARNVENYGCEAPRNVIVVRLIFQPQKRPSVVDRWGLIYGLIDRAVIFCDEGT